MVIVVIVIAIINIIVLSAIIVSIKRLYGVLKTIRIDIGNLHGDLIIFKKNTNIDMIHINGYLENIKNKLCILNTIYKCNLNRVYAKDNKVNTKTKNEAKNSCIKVQMKHKSHKNPNDNVKLNIAKNDK